jgi:hypothetical protein
MEQVRWGLGACNVCARVGLLLYIYAHQLPPVTSTGPNQPGTGQAMSRSKPHDVMQAASVQRMWARAASHSFNTLSPGETACHDTNTKCNYCHFHDA